MKIKPVVNLLCMWALLFGLGYTLMLGCSARITVEVRQNTNQPTMSYSDDISAGQYFWHLEASDRYDGAYLVVVCHGLSFNDQWYVMPDNQKSMTVEKFIEKVRDDHYWEGRIILITCNPGGHTLDSPGVTYALDNVWVAPDFMLEDDENYNRDFRDDNVGDIDEFVENPLSN